MCVYVCALSKIGWLYLFFSLSVYWKGDRGAQLFSGLLCGSCLLTHLHSLFNVSHQTAYGSLTQSWKASQQEPSLCWIPREPDPMMLAPSIYLLADSSSEGCSICAGRMEMIHPALQHDIEYWTVEVRHHHLSPHYPTACRYESLLLCSFTS